MVNLKQPRNTKETDVLHRQTLTHQQHAYIVIPISNVNIIITGSMRCCESGTETGQPITSQINHIQVCWQFSWEEPLLNIIINIVLYVKATMKMYELVCCIRHKRITLNTS